MIQIMFLKVSPTVINFLPPFLCNILYIEMVKSYCDKQNKQTECVPGSERIVKAKNGRLMINDNVLNVASLKPNSSRETN